MSELLRVLADEHVDDEALREAAAAAEAVLEVRDADVEGVAPVLHEGAADAGQRAIDDAVAGCEPELELILSTTAGQARRQQIRPHPDPGAAYLLEEAEWTGCSWRPAGSEALTRVEVDGEVWHEADARDGVVEGEAGP